VGGSWSAGEQQLHCADPFAWDPQTYMSKYFPIQLLEIKTPLFNAEWVTRFFCFFQLELKKYKVKDYEVAQNWNFKMLPMFALNIST